VDYCNCTLVKVNITNRNAQSLRDTATEAGQQSDQKLVSQAFSRLFDPFYFFYHKVRFHLASS
jgi:hypothetical protein